MSEVFPEPEYAAAAAAAGASDLARRGAGRSAVRAAAVGHRLRLPHQRRVLSRTTCRATGSWPAPAAQQRLPARVQAEIAAALAIGINVLAYATNRELKSKVDFFTTAAAESPQDDFDRGKLYVARLRHPGGCNAAPARWRTCCARPAKSCKLRVDAAAARAVDHRPHAVPLSPGVHARPARVSA